MMISSSLTHILRHPERWHINFNHLLWHGKNPNYGCLFIVSKIIRPIFAEGSIKQFSIIIASTCYLKDRKISPCKTIKHRLVMLHYIHLALVVSIRCFYLIFASLNSQCLRIVGSYLRLTIFSVIVREFFFAT